ncbi:MAG: sigma-70 family RNA polymerase sigma factor [Planctomycetia bacterium]|nr:MAG: sigma-70 family RNA polymerase sigma factor [Planctomycetota bacterium]KAB2950253.1 MAG: sigma-70 family RNA polymerase sigma factor [Phycisphaerae bacterium]MBE7456138.1 sigma-70 family RNA polymerase sigma factor [Planctomycetia bacterium]MCQ3921385.1 RNA polymerase sigma factor [Planctomycetota bacterium]
MDEAAVVEGCRRGDRAAQRVFYEQHADRIYALTLRMTDRPEDAFDLTQDTFLRAFQQFANFDARAAAGTWLYRIAVNETLQFFRRRDRERTRLEASRPEATGRTDDGTAAPAETDVAAALADLSLEHRVILILKYQTGLDYAEIAEVLDCAPGTVASRLNRARAELRRALEAREAGEEPRRVRHPTSRG